MSELNIIEIRAILRHYWKQGYKAAEAASKICEVEDEGTVEIIAAQIWFQKFNKGDLSLQNKVRTGRPLSIDPDELRTAVESNPSTTTRELSVELQT
jgi:transposase